MNVIVFASRKGCQGTLSRAALTAKKVQNLSFDHHFSPSMARSGLIGRKVGRDVRLSHPDGTL